MPQLLKLFGALTLLALLLAACGGGGASTAPTAAPAPAAAPTAAPAAEAPTAAPAAAGGAGKITGEVTLWHAYGAGGAEEAAINQLINKAKADNPDAKITVLEVPFDQIFKKFETESATGGGPDMFIAPNDSLGSEVRAGLE